MRPLRNLVPTLVVAATIALSCAKESSNQGVLQKDDLVPVGGGFDRQVPRDMRRFFYLPFMHSEELADQERCVALARDYGDEEFTRYAEHHADIVRRLGRFPHRNGLLDRKTTPAEQEFLDGGGFAG